jgi:predicted HAD superfamily Cof-like phosphohydrolase
MTDQPTFAATVFGQNPLNPFIFLGASGFKRARAFHQQFGIPVNERGYQPTVEDRLLRGKLLLEEVVEHLGKGLGLRVVVDYDPRLGDDGGQYFRLEPVQDYDPVETLDGLADIKVIANGTGVLLGLPVEAADYEVFCSNMTKLDADGQPIVNGVTAGYLEGEPGHRSDLPVGKVLKSDRYTPANIVGLLALSE